MTRRAERVMLAGVIDYELRPVEAGDSAALYVLHRATMRTYVEDVYGTWNEDVQKAARRERALTLDVFGVNPARRLYERLGFQQIGVSGQKVHMRRAQG